MSWKEAGRLAAMLLVINLVGAGFGTAWEWVAVGVLLLAVATASWLSHRAWRRRIDRLRSSDPKRRDRDLATLPPEDRAAARLELNEVTSSDARVDPLEGESFAYPVTPTSLRIALLAESLLMALLPSVLLLTGRVPDDERMWATLVGLGFAIGALVVLWSWDWERRTIRITASGLQEVRPDGRRVGMLWSEVAWVRNRRWLLAIDVHAVDGRRRIRIWYTLDGFSRMMELLTAHLMWASERFARASDGASGEGAGGDT